MKAAVLVFLVVSSSAILSAQSENPRIILQDLLDALADPEVARVPQLSDSIQRNGIQFDVQEEVLGKILDAGRQGKRDPKEMAALITAALAACQDCRARYLTAMNLEEFRILLTRFTSEAVFREVRARGVTGLEPSEATQSALRAWGAKEDLITFLIPDDKIPTIPLVEPYKAVTLKRAQEYDPGAQEGWLKISMELPPASQSELIFKHTALFVKTTAGGEPKDMEAYFNKPAPRNKTFDLINIECGLEATEGACGPEALDEKRGTWVRSIVPKKSKSKKPLIEYTYVAPDGDGRAGFQIAVDNPEKTAQKYTFDLSWRVLEQAKSHAPASGGKGGKR